MLIVCSSMVKAVLFHFAICRSNWLALQQTILLKKGMVLIKLLKMVGRYGQPVFLLEDTAHMLEVIYFSCSSSSVVVVYQLFCAHTYWSSELLPFLLRQCKWSCKGYEIVMELLLVFSEFLDYSWNFDINCLIFFMRYNFSTGI